MQGRVSLRRRRVLGTIAMLGLPGAVSAQAPGAPAMLARPVPSSGEALPVIGLGSWITFNVGNDRAECAALMRGATLWTMSRA